MEERTLTYLEENAKELQARGLNIAYWTAALRAALNALKVADARQEALKAEAKASAASVNAADHEAYVLASGVIDAVVAAWGKDSEDGQVVARMRSKLHRAAIDAEVLPVGTPPS
ncbi:MAG TPA: hypothetical protein VGR51_01490 [Thermoplasmata archaeon]|nr:hypothetical protein [Thermoplasmata archaeon]